MKHSQAHGSIHARSLVLLLLCLVASVAGGGRFRQTCSDNGECKRISGLDYECNDGECQHKPLFPFVLEITAKTIVGYILFTILSALSMAGGAGGGAVLAPILLFNFGYTIPETGPLTKATTLAGTLISFILVMAKPHPKQKDEYMIDYGLSSILFPLLCAGSMVSVLLTKMLPPIVSIALPTIILIRSAINIYGNARKMQMEENNATNVEIEPLWRNGNLTDRKRILALSLVEERTVAFERFKIDPNKSAFLEDDGSEGTDNRYMRVQVNKYAHHFNIGSIILDVLVIVACFLVVVLVSLLRGGRGFDSLIGINSCGWTSWIIFAGGQIFCLICTGLCYRKHGERILGRKHTQENFKKLKSLVRWAYLAGLASGFLGLGSGLIMNPAMLNLGFLPEVATSISSFSGLVTSASSTSQFVVQGALTLKDSAVFMTLSALGSFLGGTLVIMAVKKFRKPSILVWIVFTMTAISAVILPILGTWKILQAPGGLGFEGPC